MSGLGQGGSGSGVHLAMVRAQTLCLRVIGDSQEPPAQLNGSRYFALLIEDNTDRDGIGLGDDEHPNTMETRATAGKRGAYPR